ncbi:PAS-domain containing protein [Thioclava sp. 15-R06ZXC-3]|uniref:PAS-domain containing protein n=1 Tax=Thioclava arctica TaxID=3238301 RepID=A0ABV3TI64_9RHOB
MANVWFEAALIALTSIGSGVLALIILWNVIGDGVASRRATATHPELEETVFLFDDEVLVDASGPARALLEATPMGASDWARLSAFIAPRFRDFTAQMASLAERGRIELTGKEGDCELRPLQLIAENVNGLARITLSDPNAEGHGVLVDSLSQCALEDELEMMRQTLDRSPALAWREDENGVIGWANRAYILKSGAFEATEDGFVWPLPSLFQIDTDLVATGPRRLALDTVDGAKSWYDCHSFALHSSVLHFALPADATVRAEKALRDFVQTLTKTFADLPIGLAIFDRQRQLQLFNPALIDLLQLSPQFLSGRPTLYAFLDRLREARMMPEPKDYRSWRLQMTELENAAAAGFHSETWSLPGGQTYRVTGRPHPDGAVAFLFEDISVEIAATRRFRAELEMSHEVLDQIEDAVAVFQSSGELLLSNSAYARMWSLDPEAVLGQMTLIDAIGHWQQGCKPTAFWAKLRERANRIGMRDSLSETISLRDGQVLTCQLNTLNSGALMVRFLNPVVTSTKRAATPRRKTNLIAHG